MVVAALPCKVSLVVIIGSSLVSTYVHGRQPQHFPLDAPLIALASALTRHGTCTVGIGAASASNAVASPATAAVPATISGCTESCA